MSDPASTASAPSSSPSPAAPAANAAPAGAATGSPPPSRVSRAVAALAPSGIRRFFDLVANMPDVISLSVGEPDFRTPPIICEAARDVIDHGWLGYSGNQGFPETCAAIGRYMARRFEAAFDPASEIMVTVGASQAIDLATRATLNPGDEVVVIDPSFVSYRPMIHLAGGVPVGVTARLENGYRPLPGDLAAAITPRTRAILLGYPNNPTGATYDDELLREVALLAERHDLIVYSDEIYAELTFDRPHRCFATLPGMKHRTIVISGMSKAFAMTGWRLGYACGPADLIGGMLRVHQYSMLSAPTIPQKAVVRALDHGEGEIERMRAEYERRRHIIHRGFNALGMPCPLPGGAFYAFADIRSTGLDDVTFCERLLRSKHVAIVPGSAFGACGSGFIRVAFTRSEQVLEQAVALIGEFVEELR